MLPSNLILCFNQYFRLYLQIQAGSTLLLWHFHSTPHKMGFFPRLECLAYYCNLPDKELNQTYYPSNRVYVYLSLYYKVTNSELEFELMIPPETYSTCQLNMWKILFSSVRDRKFSEKQNKCGTRLEICLQIQLEFGAYPLLKPELSKASCRRNIVQKAVAEIIKATSWKWETASGRGSA